uniref:Uncharacterized protein n=1 Tax=Romanomermis culicivorax TaxID=13658 RepID=A0A915JAV7_ROMCU
MLNHKVGSSLGRYIQSLLNRQRS